MYGFQAGFTKNAERWLHGSQKVVFDNSKAKNQNIYEGYKPYWANLHKKTLYLYYDPSMKEMKCMYHMPAISDLAKLGKTKITFVSRSNKPDESA